jgi:hypothetical protein
LFYVCIEAQGLKAYTEIKYFPNRQTIKYEENLNKLQATRISGGSSVAFFYQAQEEKP